MLKVELHAHTSDDPSDDIGYSTHQLINRAAQLHYRALAITLHDRQLDIRPYAAYAADVGITLIPGIERTIEGRHVLLLNFSPASELVRGFDDLAHLKKRERGIVVAPHPFFPVGSSMRDLMDVYCPLIDAVEYNAMFTTLINFNRKAEQWARRYGKPLVGNGDVHKLRQLGSTYSLVDSAPTANAICEAIRRGHVAFQARPLPFSTAATVVGHLVAGDMKRSLFHQVPAVRRRLRLQ